MSLYNAPEHVNHIFNIEEYVSTLDNTLTERDANDLFIRRNGTESVYVGINFINKQTFHDGQAVYNNLSIKDENDISQLVINKTGINDMTLTDIEYCSGLNSQVQKQIDDIADIHADHADLISANTEAIGTINDTVTLVLCQ